MDDALDLIDRGAYISAKDVYGRTPLHWACMNGYKAIALALVDRGADIHEKDKHGKTSADFCSPDILPMVYRRLHASTMRSETMRL
jgi:ankyrin repeat protein